MSGEALFLGVDGGGSKTAFVCIDRAGRELARAETGGTYHLQIGVEAVLGRLAEGLAAIRSQLGSGASLALSFFGLPAYGEDKAVDEVLGSEVGRLLGHDRYVCGNDMVCGWAGSLACEDGINLVAGTGSIAYGERRGRGARAGGWGEVFGDEGSAYWIAIQGLAAFSRMSDGRATKGPLYAHLLAALDLKDDLDLCARIMGEAGVGRDAIAGLARLVSRAAQEGDNAACAILDAAAGELFALADALRGTLGFEAQEIVQISWSGGVLIGETRVRETLTNRLQKAGVYRIVEPRYSPAHGAALYARKLANLG